MSSFGARRVVRRVCCPRGQGWHAPVTTCAQCARILSSSGKAPEGNFQLFGSSSVLFWHFSSSLLVAEYLLASSKWLLIFDLGYFNECSKIVWDFLLIFLLILLLFLLPP